jgi:hypothetical protein
VFCLRRHERFHLIEIRDEAPRLIRVPAVGDEIIEHDTRASKGLGEHQRLRSGRVRAVAVALVFRDDNHLTVEHAEALSPVVGALVDRALPGG